MNTEDFILTLIRILALILVATSVIFLIIKFKKSKSKILHRCLILITVVFILFATLLPHYLIIPNKVDLSSFESIIEFHEKKKENHYTFDTKNYSGFFYVEDIDELEKCKEDIKSFAKAGVECLKSDLVFSEEKNGINWLSAPVFARRSEWTLGFRYDVSSKMILWDDKNIVCVRYWYNARGFLIQSLTFHELFYKKALDFEEILESYEMKTE